jgi:hypothetical protein
MHCRTSHQRHTTFFMRRPASCIVHSAEQITSLTPGHVCTALAQHLTCARTE